MKRTLILATLAAALAGAYALVGHDAANHAPPARLTASENPAVAGSPAPSAAWGRDELRAPPRTAERPTQPALPKSVVVLANQRELPEPPARTELP